jgi:hypothetical protein
MPSLIGVPSHDVDALWPIIGPVLRAGLHKHRLRTFEAEDVLENARAAKWQVWVVATGGDVEAVVVTNVTVTPQAKVLSVMFVAGEGARRWIHLIEDLKAWGRSIGCTDFTMSARKGWLRLMGVPWSRVERATIQETL